MIASNKGFIDDQPLLEEIIDLAKEKKAKHLVILDLRGISSITDYFLICHGDSDPQVKAIADHIRKGTTKKPKHLEGYENRNWILLDYFDVVIHSFKENEREYYGIERLWADAPIMRLTNATN